MDRDEQRLIEDLFDQLKAEGRINKDQDADELIRRELGRNPDAAYLLVQSVLIGRQQIADQEQRLVGYEQQLGRGPGTHGGFLSSAEPRVAAGPLQGLQARPSPWDRDAAMERGAPPPPPPGNSGGFLRSALSTAAGVAGGMMIGDGLRGLFGGSHAEARELAGRTSESAALADADRTQDQLQDEELAREDADADTDSSGGYDDTLDV